MARCDADLELGSKGLFRSRRKANTHVPSSRASRGSAQAEKRSPKSDRGQDHRDCNFQAQAAHTLAVDTIGKLSHGADEKRGCAAPPLPHLTRGRSTHLDTLAN